jgi:HSP20 family protein
MVHFRFPIHQLPTALQEFASEMETIVDQVFNKSDCQSDGCDSPNAGSAYTPDLDIFESEGAYNLYLDLPGVTREAIKLEMQDEYLVVSGTREKRPDAEAKQVHRNECSNGAFLRSIRLTKLLDMDKIEASFENGVLHILLPKQAKPLSRTIEIKKV